MRCSDDEKLVGLLEDALLELIWIVTKLASPLDAIEQQDKKNSPSPGDYSLTESKLLKTVGLA
ncbi:hypothetical protein PsorP6_018225 [Peronosclerospora sorghi]|uniref:Uncharacterized protein n=1 Tax=Peronosclerospora sorghi TaxID=230839 RepID=A0ACC0WEL0_9STRA|nr:hypothetical protein PsorP6_018225 [Peronosclerospora sorghi]